MGRAPGQIDRGTLGYGQMLALVTRGVAEWVVDQQVQRPIENQQRTENRPNFKRK